MMLPLTIDISGEIPIHHVLFRQVDHSHLALSEFGQNLPHIPRHPIALCALLSTVLACLLSTHTPPWSPCSRQVHGHKALC